MGEPTLYIKCGAICLDPYKKYNSVLKDLREQTRWVALFRCKDRDSFEDCLRENEVIPTREQRALARQQLAETKQAKLLLKTDRPPLIWCYTTMFICYGATEGLLIAVLGKHVVLLFLLAWHVATTHACLSLHFRRARRLAIAIAGKMDCDELIDELLSCSGEIAEQRQGAGYSVAALPGRTAATSCVPLDQ